MPKQILLIFATIALLLPSYVHAIPTTIDFESLADSDIVTNQFPGLTFSHTTVLTAGVSLNELEFPPHSGGNVVSDDGGPISIAFTIPQGEVSGFFTYTTQLTLTAFDALHHPLDITTPAFQANLALSSDPGSSPNEFLRVFFPNSITSVTLAGAPFGGSFTLDNLKITSIPEPSTLLLLASSLAGLLGWRSVRRFPMRNRL